MTTRYVRHISGQGERWLVAHETPERWIVAYKGDEFANALNLPKSEYVLVAQPERWVDVTEQCEVQDGEERPRIMHKIGRGWSDIRQVDYYRLVKVQLWKCSTQHGEESRQPQAAFLVEKKETP